MEAHEVVEQIAENIEKIVDSRGAIRYRDTITKSL